MPVWAVVLDIAGLVLLGLILVAVYLIGRRRWLSRHGGTFDLGVQTRTTKPGRGWVLGIARYSGGDLEWFRVFSLSSRAKKVFQRSGLELVSRRSADSDKDFLLYDDAAVVSVVTPAIRSLWR